MSDARVVSDLCLRRNHHRGWSDAGSGPVVAASRSSLYVTDERAHPESWRYPQSRREDLVLGQGSLTSGGRTKVWSRDKRQPRGRRRSNRSWAATSADRKSWADAAG